MANGQTCRPVFTQDFQQVQAVEDHYIEERREKNRPWYLQWDRGRWGLSLSGGGIRSATFGLGLIQALIKARRMERFDYLSTVSGGGYIGGCLSSLLSHRTNLTKLKCDAKKNTGVEPENSPFVGLGATEPYGDKDHTNLTVRHQMHHLRTHGEYLMPRRGLLSRDVLRAVGCVVPGTAYTILIFLLVLTLVVSVTHLGLMMVDPQLETLAPSIELQVSPEASGNIAYLKAVVVAWWEHRLAGPLSALVVGVFLPSVWYAVVSACIGLVVGGVGIWYSHRKAGANGGLSARSGWTPEDEGEWELVRAGNWLALGSLVGAFEFGGLVQWYGHEHNLIGSLLWPFWFWAAALVCCTPITVIVEECEVWKGRQSSSDQHEDRYRRSRFASLRGLCLTWAAAAALVPPSVIVLLSLADLPWKFLGALAALVWSWYLTKGAGSALTAQLGGWVKKPMANVAVLVFLAFAFAQMSAWLLDAYRLIFPYHFCFVGAASTAVVAVVILVGLGFRVDANRMSPHYFYRDRLTEAYLKTNARVRRDDNDDQQGMPLKTLRDDEDLKLSELGMGNGRGPYHLIVTALNLRGSKELNRKTFLSDHFIFSKDYIGSEVTGWVETVQYRGGTTRLARAMAISAAAVGSAMGQHSYPAQAFVTTLLNARLGYWMENPWNYRWIHDLDALVERLKDATEQSDPVSRYVGWPKENGGTETLLPEVEAYVPRDDTKAKAARDAIVRRLTVLLEDEELYKKAGYTTLIPEVKKLFETWNVAAAGKKPWALRNLNRTVLKAAYPKELELPPQPDKRSFWPFWLGIEILGLSSARRRLVNLSDGGHTGDNLGLLPLLQRRCAVILVSDAEEDPDYCFDSFNNAVRLAFIELNIKITIDLSDIMTSGKGKAGYRTRNASVIRGRIEYPEGKSGILVYVKSSLSGTDIPVHVANYARGHKAFPHETTVDQFFDDAQFEAYRALGEHLGHLAATTIPP